MGSKSAVAGGGGGECGWQEWRRRRRRRRRQRKERAVWQAGRCGSAMMLERGVFVEQEWRAVRVSPVRRAACLSGQRRGLAGGGESRGREVSQACLMCERPVDVPKSERLPSKTCPHNHTHALPCKRLAEPDHRTHYHRSYYWKLDCTPRHDSTAPPAHTHWPIDSRCSKLTRRRQARRPPTAQIAPASSAQKLRKAKSEKRCDSCSTCPSLPAARLPRLRPAPSTAHRPPPTVQLAPPRSPSPTATPAPPSADRAHVPAYLHTTLIRPRVANTQWLLPRPSP